MMDLVLTLHGVAFGFERAFGRFFTNQSGSIRTFLPVAFFWIRYFIGKRASFLPKVRNKLDIITKSSVANAFFRKIWADISDDIFYVNCDSSSLEEVLYIRNGPRQ